MSTVAITAAEPRRRSTTEQLRRLMARFPDGGMTLGAMVDDLGAAGIGLCLLLFSLITLIPGVAPVFGLALCALAFGMVLGRTEPWLPQRLRRWRCDRNRVEAGLRRLDPVVAWLERWLRPRTIAWLNGPASRLSGSATLLNGVLIVLPIPFGNTAPAIAMLILSLGLVAGDGVAVGVGLLATGIALAVDISLVGLGYAAVVAMTEQLV